MEASELFKGHTNPESECVDGVTGSCLSKLGEKKLKEYVKSPKKSIEDYVEAAKEKSGCKTNKCVAETLFKSYLAKPEAEQKAEEVEQLKEDAEVHFKPQGPANSTKWLSNLDIEKILNSWAHIYGDSCTIFPFCMIDFEKTNELFNDLNIDKLKKAKLKAICVLNTDVSTGPGKHWICVCIDATTENPVIEYFDSGGNPPPKELHKKLLEWSTKYSATIKYSTVKHQRENTECGVYCLFFIDKRLRGEPYEYFLDKRISDENMQKFRKYLFAPI